MSDTLLRALDLIQPGDLVQYHGSKTKHHGLLLAEPCDCPHCRYADLQGSNDSRYRLYDPFSDLPGLCVLRCVRRLSITRSTANA
ncbi:hypothetical protein [Streptomyces sp. NPDC006551]|uniref:hypothetical protein n=1 Tax=Streptomyces sp. NPDC006551 TaxID=3157178 RepID=UPI0033A68597